ncbi:DNA (cytosine-5)-methyltransferase CMT2 [Dichanthelium oligosanthes]|uniref:DNA (cytosine-5-)-methyltransferase n=1 Tax=Dichanthelium oligosanthes TaxID=888268 RepID=A0A1E5WER4_9POAL|nr:DNA (cytosine-5)-methyltransferase CMT2 [Dichanthelium oligosanthes]
MEPPPPDPSPTSPSSPPAEASSPGGGDAGAAEGDDAAGFSAGLEPLWSLLFGDPEELEPMWSPPRDFGVDVPGFAAPDPDADAEEEGDAEGPWDGAPWRSTGLVAGEGAAAAATLGVPPAAGFPAFEPAAPASPGAAPEVRPPLDSVPDSSSSPVPPCSPAPVASPELVPGCEPALPPPAAASSEAELEERFHLECTLNSVPSPPAPPSPDDDPDLGAEDAPDDGSSQNITSGAMAVVIGFTAVERPEVNAASCSVPDVSGGDGTSLRRSPRIVAVKAKENAASLEHKVHSSRASKLCLAVSGRSSISEESQRPESATVAPIKPADSKDIIMAMQSSSTDAVVALPVVSRRSLKNKAVSVSSPRKTRSASRGLVSSNRVSAVSPVLNREPTVHKAGSHTPPRKHELGSEKCLLHLERVDAVSHNSGLVSADNVVNEMPLELQAASSQPPNAKRARVSSGKCSSNLKREENNSSSICELPVVDKFSTDSEMVDSKDGSCFFMGEAVPDEEARQRWPNRYGSSHCLLKKGPEGKPHYIGRLLEFFETSAGEYYFSVQWFFRAEDTVMEDQAQSHDPRRLFYSDLKDDNLLDCIVSKVTIVQVASCINEKSQSIPSFHYYYDMKYSLDYSTFSTVEMGDINDTLQSHYTTSNDNVKRIDFTEKQKSPAPEMRELSLLDLYCGCGGMSTGLCLGARSGAVNLIARWSVDGDEAACESFRLNHPETRVRNETTDDFLELLKEWEKLCKTHVKLRSKVKSCSNVSTQSSNETPDCSTTPPEEFEVWKLVDICFGDPNGVGNRGLYFKGNVDVLCGGPPCQGISGYNRNREFDAPFNCERNKQIIVFMDVMQFLKPRYIYMENVLDILKFADATLARYALSRLVAMHYQAKLGIMAAGCYGLPQFRMRKLPPFPLPTHEAIVKNGCPLAFERNLVGWPEGMAMQLEKPIVLEDALSDLPEVKETSTISSVLFQGANFRDLPGVIVGADNVARLDPTKERVLLPSGNPLVIDCVLTYENGKSLRPYGRLWWDEVVGTVLTCPNARMQALIHPAQDRLLTIRESARLQGFPDSFRFRGTIKDRYRQIGNAVAVPVGRALGYALAMAILNKTGDDPLMVLPPKFAFSHDLQGLSSPNGLQSGNI